MPERLTMKHSLVSVSTTGQTPFFSTMMQHWAEQTCFERDIESYCLDAPDYIPTGVTRCVGRGTHRMGQALSNIRPGTWE
jgi:hypothetical protein